MALVGLFSGLDKRDEKEHWYVRRRFRKLSIAYRVDNLLPDERKNDPEASNCELNRGPGASSYIELRARIASFIERFGAEVMANGVGKREQQTVIDTRVAQDSTSVQTNCAGQ